MNITSKSDSNREQMIPILLDFTYMWDGNQGRIKYQKLRIKYTKTEVRPTYLAPCISGPFDRKYDKIDIKNIPDKKII